MIGSSGGDAEDGGGGFAGRLDDAGAVDGVEGGVAADHAEGVAGAVEGADGLPGALGGEGVGAEAGEVADVLQTAADIGAARPAGQVGDAGVELAREVGDADVGIEEGVVEAALEVMGDGGRHGDSARWRRADGRWVRKGNGDGGVGRRTSR